MSQLKEGKMPPGLRGKYTLVGSIANGRGNGIDVILKSKSGKYVFVEVKAAARVVSDGSGFNKFQRSFNQPGKGGGPKYIETQMQRIADSYSSGTGQYQTLRTGGNFLTGEEAARIHNKILKQGGYGNVKVFVARVNNVTSERIPGTDKWRYTGSDAIRWVQWLAQ